MAPDRPLDFLFDEPIGEAAGITVVLAHGAGAAMDSPFMDAIARGLAARGLRVARFEFPYMAARRHGGSRRPPSRMPELEACWRRAVEQLGGGKAKKARLVIGGKSMGGRVASRVADSLGVRGLVCLGYPFHPPGKPPSAGAETRTAHLADLATPTLILQGTRDPFGTPAEVDTYALSPRIRLHWLGDGDHSFKPRKRSGFTQEGHLETAIEAIATFTALMG